MKCVWIDTDKYLAKLIICCCGSGCYGGEWYACLTLTQTHISYFLSKQSGIVLLQKLN
jgi:hypothetical protein